MKKVLIIASFFLVLITSFAMGAVTLPFSDGFETYVVGQEPPSPWFTLAAGKGTVTNAAAYPPGTKSLRVSGGSFASQTSLVDLGPNYPDKIGYEAWIKIDSLNSGIFIGFFEQFGNQAPQYNAVNFSINGNVYYKAGQDIIIKSSYTLGVWNHARVEIDFSSLSSKVWINGELIDGLPAVPKNTTYQGTPFQLRKIGVEHQAGAAVFVDDFSVFEGSEVIDSGFLPTRNEFLFSNFGGFYGIPILEQVFPVLGNCAGMTYASLYYYYLNTEFPSSSCVSEPSISERIYIESLSSKYNNALANIFLTLSPPSESENLSNYNLIKSYIANSKLPYPIALKLRNGVAFHAVLVYKIVDNGDFKRMYVYDSNCPFCSYKKEYYIELEQSQNGLLMKPYVSCSFEFEIFRPYDSPFNPIDFPQGWALLSPGHIKVTDPDGFIIDPSLNQIQNASYIYYDFDKDGVEDQLVIIGTPKQGQYKIQVIPNPYDPPDATYSLNAFSSGTEKLLAKDSPLTQSPAEGYKTYGTTSVQFDVLNKFIIISPKLWRWPVIGWIKLPERYAIQEIEKKSIKLNGRIPAKFVELIRINKEAFVIFEAAALIEDAKLTQDKEFSLIVTGEFKSGGNFLGKDSVRIFMGP